MIKAIDRATVHRICSGQVVVDLATAVKEMVENSLDSSATVIEVKLKNMGIESIEVCDNGKGIDPVDYGGIAMKHHTSKLQVFSDVFKVTSFGFRGEALNSLCELSGKFIVSTRQETQPVGALLNFDSLGRLLSQQVVGRAVGTSVLVEGLFEKLPVRRGELVRNAKKHFVRLVKVIQSYALVSLGVKIVVTNVNSDPAFGSVGSKQTVLATQSGTRSLLDTTSILFGAAFAATLLPVSISMLLDPVDISEQHQLIPDPRSASDQSDAETTTTAATMLPQQEVRIAGFVSKVGEGVGRSDNERQFIFCNGRPVDNARFNRAMNEVWRRYEMKHKPAFILSLSVPPGFYDVNVTPDKREVVILHEAVLVERLRAAVDALYEPSRSIFKISSGLVSSHHNACPVDQSSVSKPAAQSWPVAMKPISWSSTVSKTDSSVDTENAGAPVSAALELSASTLDLRFSSKSANREAAPHRRIMWRDSADENDSRIKDSSAVPAITSQVQLNTSTVGEVQIADQMETIAIMTTDCVAGGEEAAAGLLSLSNTTTPDLPRREKRPRDADNSNMPSSARSVSAVDVRRHAPTPARRRCRLDKSGPTWQLPTNISATPLSSCERQEVRDLYQQLLHGSRASQIDQAGNQETEAQSMHSEASSDKDIESALRAAQCRETGSSSASPGDDGEPDLEIPNTRMLFKKDFARMRVVGQFNLGFIVALLDDDLFVLDQHACDEKYRFELLQRTTTIHQQPLLAPLCLETSVAMEMVIADNLDVFERNGFRIRVDSCEEIDQVDESGHKNGLSRNGGRVKILSVPFSKSVQFGPEDVNELASIISDTAFGSASGGSEHTEHRNGNKTYLMLKNDAISRNSDAEGFAAERNKLRLPKLVSMFASRACRSAIMVGTALSHQEMRNVVEKMEHVEQPWNCPHGRPTMKHLFRIQRPAQDQRQQHQQQN